MWWDSNPQSGGLVKRYRRVAPGTPGGVPVGSPPPVRASALRKSLTRPEAVLYGSGNEGGKGILLPSLGNGPAQAPKTLSNTPRSTFAMIRLEQASTHAPRRRRRQGRRSRGAVGIALPSAFSEYKKGRASPGLLPYVFRRDSKVRQKPWWS